MYRLSSHLLHLQSSHWGKKYRANAFCQRRIDEALVTVHSGQKWLKMWQYLHLHIFLYGKKLSLERLIPIILYYHSIRRYFFDYIARFLGGVCQHKGQLEKTLYFRSFFNYFILLFPPKRYLIISLSPKIFQIISKFAHKLVRPFISLVQAI